MRTFFKKLYQGIPFKKQLFTLIRPFGLSKKRYQHLHFKGPFKIKMDEKRSFRMVSHGTQIENELFWSGLYGAWEKESMKLWVQLAERSEVILDVGSNTGVYALAAACSNSKAKVHAMEPVDRIYKILQENVRLNDFEVTTNHWAASNYDGVAVIYDNPEVHTLSVAVNKDLTQGNATAKVEIPTKRLDTWISKQGISKIDLMKIDVETHEREVLEGMGESLKAFYPSLLVEILDDEIGQGIQDLLERTGNEYLYFNIDEKAGARQVKKLSRSDGYNFLICSPSVAEYLGLTN